MPEVPHAPLPDRTGPTDEQIAGQLRAYAQEAEKLVAPTPSLSRSPRWRPAPIGVAAIAAAVIAVLAGAALLTGLLTGGASDDVITPAEGGSDGAPTHSTVTGEVPGHDDPCPGVMITLDQTATADPGFPVANTSVLGYMPFRFRIDGADPGTWVELHVDYPSFASTGDAPVSDTVAVTMCNPMSDSAEPVEVDAQVLATPNPTVKVFVDNPLPPGEDALVIVSGGPDTTVDNLLRTIATFRWNDLPRPTTTVPGDPDPPLMAAVDDAHIVDFDSVGGYRLGQRVRPGDPGVAYDRDLECGTWYPAGVPDASQPPPQGLRMGVAAVPGAEEVTAYALYVDDPSYRTASGVGVGTDLVSLQRVYGSDLVVDRMDGWDNPTDGLLASYRDVAAVRRGDRAITFTLAEDVVTEVKVSEADSWGDDEGCA